MTALALYNLTPGTDEPCFVPLSPTPQLKAEQTWYARGAEADVRLIRERLPGIARRVAPDLVSLSFGNSVGSFDLLPGVRVDVVTGKWTGDDFDRMLDELMEIAANLPFTSGDSGAVPYDRSVVARKDVLYHAFVYLRYVLSDRAPRHDRLRPALAAILDDPHRKLLRLAESVPIGRARDIDPSSFDRLLSGQGGWMRAKDGAQADLALARALNGCLPQRVSETRVVTTFDTAENRFAKAFLDQAQGIIDGMRREMTKARKSAFRGRVLDDCDRMTRDLEPVRRAPLWADVGRMIHVPASSTVLHGRMGYREVYRHFSRLRLAARVPMTKQTTVDLLELKDIALLYELWVYFKLVEALTDLRGKPSSADSVTVSKTEVTVDWQVRVTWPNGTALTYNPSFTRKGRHGRVSTSVGLRPDVALEVPGPAGRELHLFDAKFRLERLDALLPDVDDDDAKVEERRGTFKRADLYKMHTYRDAIPEARSVWAVYPGTEFRFFTTGGDILQAGEALSRDCDGVGAVPLVPRLGTQDDLLALLKKLVSSPIVDTLQPGTQEA